MQVQSGVLPPLDGCATVGRVAALLGMRDDALGAALDLVVTDLGLSSAVLREVTADVPGGVLAVAGGVMRAIPLARRPRPGRPENAAIELPVSIGAHRLATLTVVGARPGHLPVLRACAAVLALRLDVARPVAAAELFAAADAEVSAVADALHDGPVQELVAARYAADAAAREADPAGSREAVQSALVALRRALWTLRPRGADAGLDAALRALSDQLARSGAAPLVLAVDPSAAEALDPAQASAAYRLVQAATTARPAGSPPVLVALRCADGELLLQVDGGAPLPCPRWTARARALGARLTSTPGRLSLAFPFRQEVAP